MIEECPTQQLLHSTAHCHPFSALPQINAQIMLYTCLSSAWAPSTHHAYMMYIKSDRAQLRTVLPSKDAASNQDIDG
jgi:hypothetical protein